MGFLMLVICHSGSLSCWMSNRMEMPGSWWFAFRMSVSGLWEQSCDEYWGGWERAACSGALAGRSRTGWFRRELMSAALFFVTAIPLSRLLLPPEIWFWKYLRMMVFPAKQHILWICSISVKWHVCLGVWFTVLSCCFPLSLQTVGKGVWDTSPQHCITPKKKRGFQTGAFLWWSRTNIISDSCGGGSP